MALIWQYFTNMMMALDQFVSTILGGHPDETVSQRLGRAQLAGGGKVINFSVWLVDGIAWILFKEEYHCRSSLSGKTTAKELWNWGGSRTMLEVED